MKVRKQRRMSSPDGHAHEAGERPSIQEPSHGCDAVFLRSLAPALPDRWPLQIVDVSKNALGVLVPTRLSLGVLVQT
jgi:hypothetical protein